MWIYEHSGKGNSFQAVVLSFGTDMPGQTVQTQRSSLIRVYTVCHSVCIIWTVYSMVVEPHSSNFRVITTNFLGVRIFRKFTLNNNRFGALTLFARSFRRRFFAYHYAVNHTHASITWSWFCIPLVLKCAAKILKIGLQIKIQCPKMFLNRDFA